MKVGAATQPVGGTGMLGGLGKSADDELLVKLEKLERKELEKLLEVAQVLGAAQALQLAQQMTGLAGGAKTGDFNLSDVDGSKARGSATQGFDRQQDLEKLLKDILAKQETAQASAGAEGAGNQGQSQQQPQPSFDQNQVNVQPMHEMY